MRGFGRFAKGDRSRLDADDGNSPEMGPRVTKILERAIQDGDQDRSPFFKGSTDEPCVTPRILTAAELEAVEAARDGT